MRWSDDVQTLRVNGWVEEPFAVMSVTLTAEEYEVPTYEAELLAMNGVLLTVNILDAESADRLMKGESLVIESKDIDIRRRVSATPGKVVN